MKLSGMNKVWIASGVLACGLLIAKPRPSVPPAAHPGLLNRLSAEQKQELGDRFRADAAFKKAVEADKKHKVPRVHHTKPHSKQPGGVRNVAGNRQ